MAKKKHRSVLPLQVVAPCPEPPDALIATLADVAMAVRDLTIINRGTTKAIREMGADIAKCAKWCEEESKRDPAARWSA